MNENLELDRLEKENDNFKKKTNSCSLFFMNLVYTRYVERFEINITMIII